MFVMSNRPILAKATVAAALALSLIMASPATAQQSMYASSALADSAVEQVQVPPLIGAVDLQVLMGLTEPQIVDIRNPRAIRSLYSYASGHIPGAVNVPYGTWRNIWTDPLNVPTDADMTRAIQSMGLTKDRPVVIVHSSAARGNFGSAAWVYWVLKTAGFENIAILNGGVRGWKDMGGEMSTEAVEIVPSQEVITVDQTWLATHEDVDAVINGTSDAQLLDARPLHQIMSDASIEGSFTLNAEELITGDKGMAGDDLEIFMRIKDAGLEWQRGEVITYCNNGALAAVDWFMASEIAGIPNVKVYGHSLRARERALDALES
ncbi:sulfurtransferase [Yoonia sp. SDW83-1]|uniref:sulfurtransferase n=1 Tax=Yoonia sp. SDW83-1 TaxID=3366945 RepID=UPI00398C5D42